MVDIFEYRIKSVLFSAGLGCLIMCSCNKMLDVKPLKSLKVPSSLKDFQALLDNSNVMSFQSSPAGLQELISDNYYVTTTDWQSVLSYGLTAECQNYLWDDRAMHYDAWSAPYANAIYYSNIVLDGLLKISKDNSDTSLWNAIKGTALFHRAFAFFQLAQLYCKPFSETSDTDLGIVLRLTPHVGVKSERSKVKETYSQIINDLILATELLPDKSLVSTRPDKLAAYGALARTYLSMRKYEDAGKYADLYLLAKPDLLDFNSIQVNGFPEFTKNPEVSFFSVPVASTLLDPYYGKIDSNLYKLYDDNDLRKTLYFSDNGDNTYGFNGSYFRQYGGGNVFDGIATDEMYLIRAESYIRADNFASALEDLNNLLVRRWKNNGSWVPYTSTDKTQILDKILFERRKELIYRGARWSDLRRLNLENRNITISRQIDGVPYKLEPSSLNWVLLIPSEEIQRSGIEQNPR